MYRFSHTVILLCSGLLSPVCNLRETNSDSSVSISWSAPWSLDVTGVDHDIWYSVLIQNVIDEDRPTDILCTDCTNITETHYTFTPDHLSPCNMYNFTIIPANGAGLGGWSQIAYQGWLLHVFTVFVPLVVNTDINFERRNIKALNYTRNCSVTFILICVSYSIVCAVCVILALKYRFSLEFLVS